MNLFEACVCAREAGFTVVPVDAGGARAIVDERVRLLEIGPQATAADVLEASGVSPGRGVLLRIDEARRSVVPPIRAKACTKH